MIILKWGKYVDDLCGFLCVRNISLLHNFVYSNDNMAVQIGRNIRKSLDFSAEKWVYVFLKIINYENCERKCFYSAEFAFLEKFDELVFVVVYESKAFVAA